MSAATVDLKLEVVVLPVSDVDRAKRFYEGLGWRLDADFSGPDNWRGVQMTPPGSACSIAFGTGLGGGSRAICKEFDTWVTGYEADPELSRAAKQLSVIGGMDRKAEMKRYIAGEFELSPNSFDSILSSESLHNFESKYEILLSLQKGLKPRGQLSMTDFVLGEGISPKDSRLQAMQATNQLLALQAKQSIQAQQLRITQDRAVALEQARQVAVQERAREVRRRFMGSGTPYTPYTVNFYGNP